MTRKNTPQEKVSVTYITVTINKKTTERATVYIPGYMIFECSASTREELDKLIYKELNKRMNNTKLTSDELRDYLLYVGEIESTSVQCPECEDQPDFDCLNCPYQHGD